MKRRYAAKTPTEELLEKCAVYLNDNFYKFSLTNKIKISLEIFKRSMPVSPLVDQSTHLHYTTVVQQIRQVLENEPTATDPRGITKDIPPLSSQS